MDLFASIVARNFPKALSLLSRGGADVNYVGAFGRSVLMNACGYQGSEDVAMMLLDLGADPTLADEAGNTALLYACFRPVSERVALRLATDPRVNVNPGSGPAGSNSPLRSACVFGLREVANALLDRGADPTVRQPGDGRSALLGAVESGMYDVALRIATMPSVNVNDVLAVGGMEATPLTLACAAGAEALALALVARGADLNAVQLTVNAAEETTVPLGTPLLLALKSGMEAVALAIIAAGGDVNCAGCYGSPIEYFKAHPEEREGKLLSEAVLAALRAKGARE